MGALVATFAVGQLLGYPLAGRGIQRRHAAFVLVASLALIVVGDLAFVVGEGLAVYFPARLLQGIGAGGLWMGVAFGVLERFPGQEYRRLTGILGAYSAGTIAGPALGAIGGIRGPFAAHLALVLAAFAVTAALGIPRERPVFGSDRAVFRTPGFWLASAGVMLVAIGLGTLDGPLPLHFAERLSQAEIGALYVAAALIAGLGAALSGALPPRAVLAAATVVITLGVGLAGLTDDVPLWIVAVALAGIGIGAGEAGALGVLLETTGTERIVLAMVVWSQIWAVGYLAGPAAAGGIAESLGFAAIGLVPLAAALVVFAAFAVSPRAAVRADSG
jgi:MFS family permease